MFGHLAKLITLTTNVYLIFKFKVNYHLYANLHIGDDVLQAAGFYLGDYFCYVANNLQTVTSKTGNLMQRPVYQIT